MLKLFSVSFIDSFFAKTKEVITALQEASELPDLAKLVLKTVAGSMAQSVMRRDLC